MEHLTVADIDPDMIDTSAFGIKDQITRPDGLGGDSCTVVCLRCRMVRQ